MCLSSRELASLNEFRSFFGLSVHKTFEDINGDPDIAKKLQAIYRHPDQVELYPGLVCEGQGRCLDPGTNGPNKEGTALWRAVFSDAVTLVRSDRFYTTGELIIYRTSLVRIITDENIKTGMWVPLLAGECVKLHPYQR